jgi:MFS family permease
MATWTSTTRRQRVREDIARIHAWHRATELPRLMLLLQRAERLAPGDVTPEQACAFEAPVRERLAALRERLEPALVTTASRSRRAAAPPGAQVRAEEPRVHQGLDRTGARPSSRQAPEATAGACRRRLRPPGRCAARRAAPGSSQFALEPGHRAGRAAAPPAGHAGRAAPPDRPAGRVAAGRARRRARAGWIAVISRPRIRPTAPTGGDPPGYLPPRLRRAQQHHRRSNATSPCAGCAPGSATWASWRRSNDTAVAGGAMSVVWRFALATTLIVLAFSMTGPVLAVSLQKAGASTAAVGLFAMVSFLMIGLLIPVMPRVLARWGVVRTYRAGCLLDLVGAGLYATTDHWLPWTVGSVISGVGAAGLWNATEALLAREAPPDQRGRVMGLYQTALGAALALGPFLPALLGWGERPVLWAALALVAGCCCWRSPSPAMRPWSRRRTGRHLARDAAGAAAGAHRVQRRRVRGRPRVGERGQRLVARAGPERRRQRGRRHRRRQLPVPVAGRAGPPTASRCARVHAGRAGAAGVQHRLRVRRQAPWLLWGAAWCGAGSAARSTR